MKRRYGILLGVFLLCLAVCTYVSFQMYNANLPMVRTDDPVSAALRYDWQISGSVHHKDAVVLSMPVPAQILRWAAQPGQWVKAGEPILQLDAAQLRLQWLQCKVEEEALMQRIENSTSYQKEILGLQKIDLLASIALLEQLQAEEGWVKSPTEGIVLYTAESKVPAKAPLVTIGPATGEKQLTFSLTKEQLAYCKGGTRLQAETVIGTEKTALELIVERIYYDAAGQSYRCIATSDAALNMMEGQPMTAQLSAVSAEYQTVIPNSAIVENNNGNASFYVLREKRTTLGTEYYAVLQSVYILEQNDAFTALSAPVAEPVISFRSKPLTDNAIVRVVP